MKNESTTVVYTTTSEVFEKLRTDQRTISNTAIVESGTSDGKIALSLQPGLVIEVSYLPNVGNSLESLPPSLDREEYRPINPRNPQIAFDYWQVVRTEPSNSGSFQHVVEKLESRALLGQIIYLELPLNRQSKGRKRWVVIVVTWGMVALALLLLFKLPYGAYITLKWVLSLGLTFCAGYYLLPRQRAVIEAPDEVGGRRSEIRWLTGTPVEWREGRALPIQDEEILLISRDQGCYFPIDHNVAGIHLLLAIVFCPLTRIQMSKFNWGILDIFLACYLVYALYVVLKERKAPRSTWVQRNHEGKPENYHLARQESLSYMVFEYGPMVGIFVVMVFGLAISKSGILYRSDFAILRLAKSLHFSLLEPFCLATL